MLDEVVGTEDDVVHRVSPFVGVVEVGTVRMLPVAVTSARGVSFPSKRESA